MRLSDIRKSLAHLTADPAGSGTPAGSGGDPEIRSIHYRSQDVVPGGLFVAIPGFKVDGHVYVEDAVAGGAVAVVAEKPLKTGVEVIRVRNARLALADASAAFYHHPSEALTVIGITGTNGKTTVTYLLEHILQTAGRRVGVIGTVNYRYRGRAIGSAHTTPEAVDLQRILAEMRDSGVTHVVMEVASHGIDLHRVDGTEFDVAVFTNLTQDHLDYHGNMERYWACKQRLFTELLRTGPKKDRATAVINCGDPRGRSLYPLLQGPKLSVGPEPVNDVNVVRYSSDVDGIRAVIGFLGGELVVRTRLVGHHNLENLLTAAGAAAALGIPPDVIADGLNHAPAAPGRLEPVDDPAGRHVYVDYAHTPDALENVLRALEGIKTKRLICVFGCGGDRDRKKRPIMGAIAARLSDLAVVTSDNPRSEAPMAIIQDILAGIPTAGGRGNDAGGGNGHGRPESLLVEPDRRKAIRLALEAAEPGDIVLIAGKGHETYQIVGDRTLPFDDRREASEVLQASDHRLAGKPYAR
ncbi:MAG: UDP-N-acetylmuramoyl-L-alanyl-D-glutamate--2,6-diaminopimelate ligase [Desulfobacterales bacterium]